MRRGQTLQQFIQATIQPSSEIRRDCDRVVDRVTNFLQLKTPLSVNMVIRGGSLGRSTNVRGISDVDLVVFINDVNSIQQLQDNMETILDKLQNAFARNWTGTLQLVNRSDRCLQYKLSCSDSNHVHEVDILPAYNVVEVKTSHGVFNEMMTKTDRQRRFYSPCFITEQVKLVKSATIKVKNLVRLVKYWANREVNRPNDKILKSFFLEIVVISLWKNRGSPSDFNTNDWFKEVMTQLADLTSLRILWPDIYTVSSYYDIRMTPNPVALDPANPYSNQAPQRQHDHVMTCAKKVLRRLEASRSGR
ncbi:2'-5'-oligoadenylate synthase 1A-like isoform X2 [Haliotis cracherodii]